MFKPLSGSLLSLLGRKMIITEKEFTLEDAYTQIQELLDQCGNTKDGKAFEFIQKYIKDNCKD